MVLRSIILTYFFPVSSFNNWHSSGQKMQIRLDLKQLLRLRRDRVRYIRYLPVGAPVVHPELLNGDAEGDEVEQGSDPAVESRVVVTRLHVILKLADISVLLLK